jgi:hypothetical protein
MRPCDDYLCQEVYFVPLSSVRERWCLLRRDAILHKCLLGYPTHIMSVRQRAVPEQAAGISTVLHVKVGLQNEDFPATQ